MRILIATDNHLGYMERDRARRDDSFITVEEILSIAKDRNVRIRETKLIYLFRLIFYYSEVIYSTTTNHQEKHYIEQ